MLLMVAMVSLTEQRGNFSCPEEDIDGDGVAIGKISDDGDATILGGANGSR